MSNGYGPYSMSAPNAVYANQALRRLGLATAAALVALILNRLALDTVLLDAALGTLGLIEFTMAGVFAEKSIRAGIRDGRSLTLSIREGAFVSIPEGAVL